MLNIGALPLTNGLPPSHLGIVRKHPLLSVWRRFSEYNERLPLVAIQRPTGANAILLR
ncbi:MAG: hypothetical protein IIV24_04610 [Alistipes sp.]|nr:hypothetical protein [Alistipes sp.]MBR0340416.1 hypothetical protein [Alistipes sp.]